MDFGSLKRSFVNLPFTAGDHIPVRGTPPWRTTAPPLEGLHMLQKPFNIFKKNPPLSATKSFWMASPSTAAACKTCWTRDLVPYAKGQPVHKLPCCLRPRNVTSRNSFKKITTTIFRIKWVSGFQLLARKAITRSVPPWTLTLKNTG